jgi:hypothetical protein
MKFDNGYRYYVLEYVLDRWIPISMHQTYVDAYVNVTAEHQVIARLDKMVTECHKMCAEQKIYGDLAQKVRVHKAQAVRGQFFSELLETGTKKFYKLDIEKKLNEILGNK